MTEDTSGFYRLTGKKLSFAPNAVRAPTYNLFRAERETYTYPANGWHWFDTKEQAREFFDLAPVA